MAKVRHRMRRALRDWVRLCLPQRQAGLIPQSLIILRPRKAHRAQKKRPPGILPGGRRDCEIPAKVFARDLERTPVTLEQRRSEEGYTDVRHFSNIIFLVSTNSPARMR